MREPSTSAGARIFLMNEPARKGRFVEPIQQIHPTGKSPKKSVKPLARKYSDFQKLQIRL
jgi:hypothetical protein